MKTFKNYTEIRRKDVAPIIELVKQGKRREAGAAFVALGRRIRDFKDIEAWLLGRKIVRDALADQFLSEEDGVEKKVAYFMLRTERDERGWIPCIVVEGETGYHRTDWRWDCSFETAEELVTERNARLGIDGKAATVLVLKSMGLSRLKEKKDEKATV